MIEGPFFHSDKITHYGQRNINKYKWGQCKGCGDYNIFEFALAFRQSSQRPIHGTPKEKRENYAEQFDYNIQLG